MNSMLKSQRGVSIILVLSIMVLTSIIVSGVYVTLNNEYKAGHRNYQGENAQALARNANAIAESWFATRVDSVAMIVNTLLEFKELDPDSILNLSHILPDSTDKNLYVFDAIETSKGFQFKVQAEGKGSGGSKYIMVTGYQVNGLERVFGNVIGCDSTTTLAYSNYNGEDHDCSGVKFHLYGNAYFGGNLCIIGDGSINVYAYQGMSGDLIIAGEGNSASNLNGAVRADGNILFKDADGINFNTATAKLQDLTGSTNWRSSGFDFYGSTVSSVNAYSGEEVLQDLRDQLITLQNDSTGFIITDSTLMAQADPYETRCDGVSGTSDCTTVWVDDLNKIYASASDDDKYKDFVVLDISDVANNAWPDPGSTKLEGHFALIVDKLTSVGIGYKFPITSDTSTVLLYAKRATNINWGISTATGKCNCFIVQLKGEILYDANDADTLIGGSYTEEVVATSFAGSGSLTIKHDSTVLNRIKELGFMFSDTPAHDSTGTCIKPIVEKSDVSTVVATSSRLTLKKLGTFSGQHTVDSLLIANLSPGMPLLKIAPAIVSVTDTTLSDFDDLVNEYSILTYVVGGTNCGAISYIPEDGIAMSDAIASYTLGTYMVRYTVSCEEANDTAVLVVNIEDPNVSSSSSEPVSSSGPAPLSSSSSSFTPTFNYGVIEATFQFRTALAGKCLDVALASTVNNANVRQWVCNNTGAQLWEIKQVDLDVWQIKNLRSQKDLNWDIATNNVKQYQTVAGAKTQQWKIIVSNNSNYIIQSFNDPSYCLTVAGASTANGANIEVAPCNGSIEQEFFLVNSVNRSTVLPGIYEVSNNNSNLYMEVANSGTGYGDIVQQDTATDGYEQYWEIDTVSAGVYTFKNVNSSRYMFKSVSEIKQGDTTPTNTDYRFKFSYYSDNGVWKIYSVNATTNCLSPGWATATQAITSVPCAVDDSKKWYLINKELPGEGYNIYLDVVNLEDSVRLDGGEIGRWGSCYSSISADQYQASLSWRVSCDGSGGVLVDFPVQTNLSRLNGGDIKFVIKSNTAALKYRIEWAGSVAISVALSDYGLTGSGDWEEITIPLAAFSGIDLSTIKTITDIYNPNSSDEVFYIDDLRIIQNPNILIELEAETADAMGASANIKIEACSDVDGCGPLGQNVGWIADGDWIKWNSLYITAGKYVIEARVASDVTLGHTINFLLDGTNVANAVLPLRTGGWQTYTTIESTQFTVPSNGNYELIVQFVNRDININWIKIVPDNSPLSSSSAAAPSSSTPAPSSSATATATPVTFTMTTAPNTKTGTWTDGKIMSNGDKICWPSINLNYITKATVYYSNGEVAGDNIILTRGGVGLGSIPISSCGAWSGTCTTSTVTFSSQSGTHEVCIEGSGSGFIASISKLVLW